MGNCRLSFFYFSKQSDYKICAFVADESKNNSFNSLPLISTNEVEKEFPKDEYYIHIALSYKKLNKNRQENLNFLIIKITNLLVLFQIKQQY